MKAFSGASGWSILGSVYRNVLKVNIMNPMVIMRKDLASFKLRLYIFDVCGSRSWCQYSVSMSELAQCGGSCLVAYVIQRESLEKSQKNEISSGMMDDSGL